MTAPLRRFRFSEVLGRAAALCVLGLHPLAVAAQEGDVDLALGTWVMDVEASSYRPGPPPRSQTRVYETHLEGYKATITTVNAEGQTLEAEYVADYDSLEYPLTGSTQVDAIELRRISPYVAEATLRHARKVIGTARRVISEDGKTMTITYNGRDVEGRQVHNVAVYEKKSGS